MCKSTIRILLFSVIASVIFSSNAELAVTSDVKEFDFLKKFELDSPKKDADGTVYYTLNHTMAKKFKLAELFSSPKPEAAIIDIIFRLDLAENVTFDLFEIHDNTKSEPMRASVFLDAADVDAPESDSDTDNGSHNLSDYDFVDGWYRMTFVYNFAESKVSMFYDCDPNDFYEESFERKGFHQNHHKMHFQQLVHVKMAGIEEEAHDDVEFQFDVMKLSLYTGSDLSNLGFCQELF